MDNSNLYAYALAVMVMTWLVGAWVFWRARRALPPTHGEARHFRLTYELRMLGLALIFLGPGLMLFLLLRVPIGEKDIAPVVFLTLFLGCLAPLAGVALMRMRIRIDDADLAGYTFWGLDTFLPWCQVKSIALSAAKQQLRFDGGSRPLYVPVQLHGWPALVSEIERCLPHLALPDELESGQPLRGDGDRLAFEGHWQAMYDHAVYIAAVAALVVSVSLLLLEHHPFAWFWSALGGVGLVLYPLLRRLVAKPRKYAAAIGNGIQIAGLMIFFLLTMRGYRVATDLLGGEDALSNMQWLGLSMQTLGVAVLTGAALLLLAKWRCPERYARSRMRDNGRGEW